MFQCDIICLIFQIFAFVGVVVVVVVVYVVSVYHKTILVLILFCMGFLYLLVFTYYLLLMIFMLSKLIFIFSSANCGFLSMDLDGSVLVIPILIIGRPIISNIGTVAH